MNKDLLLKDIAESGYNIGYAAKKHLATYDIVEKAPGWISIISFAFGVLALVVPQLNNNTIAAFLLIVAYAVFYFNSYQDSRLEYSKVGSRLTAIFTTLRSLYYEVKSQDDPSKLEELERRYHDLLSESQSIGISKQIFLSDWYAHYKFFWQAERSWLDEKRPFTFWRDKIPLSATLVGITLIIFAFAVIFVAFHRGGSVSDASLFSLFRQNLSVSNADEISAKYANITTRLNLDFWEVDSDTRHSLQVGSYGRKTAIDGVSDLDMVFELPNEDYERYKRLEGNGPSKMLQEVRSSLLTRYPRSDVRADGQIVAVNFQGYRVEVLPAFLDENGDYIYGDTNDGGTWKLTKPRPEINAVNELNKETNHNLKDASKMLRAWKNKAGVGIGGLLIDTLAYNFFNQTNDYDDATWSDFPRMFISLFTYLAGLDPDQEYWAAPGSGQRVRRKAKFQSKAKKAAARCQEAMDAEDEATRAKIWRKVFGKQFPKAEVVEKAARYSFDKEEFIEDRYPVDVSYNIELECEIREGQSLQDFLRRKLKRRERVPIGRHLRFYVTECNVPGNYQLFWKVRNRGKEAIDRKMLRGEITPDKGNGKEKIETSNFSGNHYVEVYAVKDGVCVAREQISVPIDA